MSGGQYPDRAARLAHIVAGRPLRQDLPLLKSMAVEPELAEALRARLNEYLLQSLETFHGRGRFAAAEDVLAAHADAVLALPNITPNGLVLPKRETCAQYGEVHAAVADIAAAAGLDAHADGFHVPVNIRLVRGPSDPAIDARPRASTKYHSDMWAGEPANAIMVFLPALGDTRNLGVRWVEPAAFPARLMAPLDDFDEGAELLGGATAYDADFVNGELILTDPFLVHATQKRGPGLRLSIDFRFIARETLGSDAPAPGTRRGNYVPFDRWREIGRTAAIDTAQRIEVYAEPDAPTRNEYAQPYAVVDFDASLTAADIAAMLELPRDRVAANVPAEEIETLRYRVPGDEEQARLLAEARAETAAAGAPPGDDARRKRWSAGWQEVCDRLDGNGGDPAPQYFRHDTLRLGGRYIRVPNGRFELSLYRALARVLFAEYLAGAGRIVDLGSGTGMNLRLLREMFPDTPLTGCDWAPPAVEMARRAGAGVDGAAFDMLTLEGGEELNIDGETAVLTAHALEQLGGRHSLLVEWLIAQRPRIVLHLEPISELYDPAQEFDQVALEYHNKRNYLDCFLSVLQEHEAASRVEILKVRRSGFGSQFHEAYSVVVWRPI